MKLPLLTLLLGLSAGVCLPGGKAWLGLQEEQQETPPPQDGEQEEDEFANLSPFARFRALERRRLEEELQGAWILTEHRTGEDGPFDDERQGFMLFHEGFVTIFVYVRTVENGFLGATEKVYAQAGSFRYRINDELFLQTASMMGFVTGDGDEIEVTGSGEGREYEIALQDGQMDLFNAAEGIRMTLRHIARTDFPAAALEDLEEQRVLPR